MCSIISIQKRSQQGIKTVQRVPCEGKNRVRSPGPNCLGFTLYAPTGVLLYSGTLLHNVGVAAFSHFATISSPSSTPCHSSCLNFRFDESLTNFPSRHRLDNMFIWEVLYLGGNVCLESMVPYIRFSVLNCWVINELHRKILHTVLSLVHS